MMLLMSVKSLLLHLFLMLVFMLLIHTLTLSIILLHCLTEPFKIDLCVLQMSFLS